MARLRRNPWVKLRSLDGIQVLLILPCNAAACVGNYFRAEVYQNSAWNTWREADLLLRDLREERKIAFAAVDSSILETAPEDPCGAIVLENEMHRPKSPDWEGGRGDSGRFQGGPTPRGPAHGHSARQGAPPPASARRLIPKAARSADARVCRRDQ
jgi:hypothetical protein